MCRLLIAWLKIGSKLIKIIAERSSCSFGLLAAKIGTVSAVTEP